MVYKNLIPQPGDSPATDSQADILENFTQIDSQFGTTGDHVAFTALADNGMHKQVSLNGVIADPGLATPQSSLYIKTVAGSSELFFQNDTLAADVVPLTGIAVTTVGTNFGYVTPWGQTINWGQFTCNTTDTVLTYAVAFSNPAQSIQLTAVSDNGSRNAVVRLSAAANATCRATNNGLAVYYYAIGV